ncbi:MAG: glycosyltransferase family 2 protein [Candidatus Hodarchaeales archaeon]|jgi:cellulose synthase/poly-beta-1,6-N-acetylglucosamine synthase-like glycosyltransferase
MDYIISFLLSLNLLSAIILIPYPVNLFFLSLAALKSEEITFHDQYDYIDLPKVTIQLPVYNEEKIIEKTMGKLENISYPLEKLKIQILDDSTDVTSDLIDKVAEKLTNKGIYIEILRRDIRKGYKAGALEYGLKNDDSEFVALFDSDFEIDPLFLSKTIHFFKDNHDIGAIQSRWGYTNLNHSLFTRAMSIGIDGHFLVEKPGRKKLNAFISFNGTGAIWRRSVIDESGGWSADTLAEDLDLAYRAQMKGFKIIYLSELVINQEIPPTIRCWIIQQSRWAKGFSQNIKGNLPRFFLISIKSSFMQTLQGTIHMTQYLVPLMIFVNTTTAVLIMYSNVSIFNFLRFFGVFFTLSMICGIMAYSVAIIRSNRRTFDILLIPLFLFWGAGLIVRMSVGTIDGLIRKGGKFDRTPKFNLNGINEQSNIPSQEYIPLDWIIVLEIMYLLILIAGIIKTMSLGIIFAFTGVYYIFIGLSILNLIVSELVHGIKFRG